MPWTAEAVEAVRDTARKALLGVPWLAFEPDAEMRVETRVVAGGFAIVCF